MASRSTRPGPMTCSCPTNSSSDLGLSRAARGWPVSPASERARLASSNSAACARVGGRFTTSRRGLEHEVVQQLAHERGEAALGTVDELDAVVHRQPPDVHLLEGATGQLALHTAPKEDGNPGAVEHGQLGRLGAVELQADQPAVHAQRLQLRIDDGPLLGAGSRADEWLAQQLDPFDAEAGCQRMVGGRYDDELLLAHGLRQQLRRQGSRRHEAEVQLATGHVIDNALRPVHAEHDAGFGVIALEAGNHRRQEVVGRCRCANAAGARFGALQLLQGYPSLLPDARDLPRGLVDDRSGLGGVDAPAFTHQELVAHLVLEGFDVLADGRLGERKLFGSGGEATAVDHLAENLQPGEIHKWSVMEERGKDYEALIVADSG